MSDLNSRKPCRRTAPCASLRMYEGKTVFSQVTEPIHPAQFQRCVSRYRGDYKVRKFSCWDQFLAMAFGQITYRVSLRDIEACLRSRRSQLYHMGVRSQVSRNTLAKANERRDWRIYADLGQRLIRKARRLYVGEEGLSLSATVETPDLIAPFNSSKYATIAALLRRIWPMSGSRFAFFRFDTAFSISRFRNRSTQPINGLFPVLVLIASFLQLAGSPRAEREQTKVDGSATQAPADFNFSPYFNPGNMLRNIYIGRFTLVDDPDKDGDGLKGSWRRSVLATWYIYQTIYSGECMRNSSESYTSIVTRSFEVTKLWGTEVDRRHLGTSETRIRNRFLDSYRTAESVMTIALLLDQWMIRTLKATVSLHRLLKDVGCRSATIKQLEDNFDRFIQQRPAVQTERSGLNRFPLFARHCRGQDVADFGLADPRVCECAFEALRPSVDHETWFDFEDNFTRDKFLIMSVSHTERLWKIRQCLR